MFKALHTVSNWSWIAEKPKRAPELHLSHSLLPQWNTLPWTGLDVGWLSILKTKSKPHLEQQRLQGCQTPEGWHQGSSGRAGDHYSDKLVLFRAIQGGGDGNAPWSWSGKGWLCYPGVITGISWHNNAQPPSLFPTAGKTQASTTWC